MITKLLGWRGKLVWVLRQFFLILEKISSNRLGVWNRGLCHGLKGSRKSSECSSQSSVSRACLSCILPFSYSSSRGKAWTDRWEAIRAWPKPTLVLAPAVKELQKVGEATVWKQLSFTGLSWVAALNPGVIFPTADYLPVHSMGPPGYDSIFHQQRGTARIPHSHTCPLKQWSNLKGAQWGMKSKEGKCWNSGKNLGRWSVITEVEICPDHWVNH